LVPTTVGNPGGNHLNPLAQYSTDIAPDMVAKIAVEPGWGHYELYGIGCLFRSRAAFAFYLKAGTDHREICDIIAYVVIYACKY